MSEELRVVIKDEGGVSPQGQAPQSPLTPSKPDPIKPPKTLEEIVDEVFGPAPSDGKGGDSVSDSAEKVEDGSDKLAGTIEELADLFDILLEKAEDIIPPSTPSSPNPPSSPQTPSQTPAGQTPQTGTPSQPGTPTPPGGPPSIPGGPPGLPPPPTPPGGGSTPVPKPPTPPPPPVPPAGAGAAAGAGGAAGAAGGAAGAGALVLPLAALAAVVVGAYIEFRILKDGTEALNARFLEMERTLRDVTPILAVAAAEREFTQLQIDRERGQRFGKSLAGVAKANDQIEQALTRIADHFLAPMLLLFEPIATNVGNVAEVTTVALEKFDKLIGHSEIMAQLLSLIAKATPGIGPIFAILEIIADYVKPEQRDAFENFKDILNLETAIEQRQPPLPKPANAGFGAPLGRKRK